jgi:hypothetical protein
MIHLPGALGTQHVVETVHLLSSSYLLLASTIISRASFLDIFHYKQFLVPRCKRKLGFWMILFLHFQAILGAGARSAR